MKRKTKLKDGIYPLGHHCGFAVVENGEATFKDEALRFPDVVERLELTEEAKTKKAKATDDQD